MLQWFQNYLAKRKQTIFHGTNSALKNIICGVSQGSILGPVLFLIYINYVSSVYQVTFPIMFADDTHFFIQRGKLGKNGKLFKH